MVQIIQPVDNFDKVSPSRYCLVFQSLQSFGSIFIEDELGVFLWREDMDVVACDVGVVDSDDGIVDGREDNVNDDDNESSRLVWEKEIKKQNLVHLKLPAILTFPGMPRSCLATPFPAWSLPCIIIT